MTFPCCEKALQKVIRCCFHIDRDGEVASEPICYEKLFDGANYCSGCGAPLKCPHCGRFF